MNNFLRNFERDARWTMISVEDRDGLLKIYRFIKTKELTAENALHLLHDQVNFHTGLYDSINKRQLDTFVNMLEQELKQDKKMDSIKISMPNEHYPFWNYEKTPVPIRNLINTYGDLPEE